VYRSLRPSRMCKHCKGETDWQELELRVHALAEFPVRKKNVLQKKLFFGKNKIFTINVHEMNDM